uniref:Uncharacterized protein n=1 Tax=Sphaerodactylus townsendi TaxID=933632 RepID=A0ACB8EN93_9SAUR
MIWSFALNKDGCPTFEIETGFLTSPQTGSESYFIRVLSGNDSAFARASVVDAEEKQESPQRSGMVSCWPKSLFSGLKEESELKGPREHFASESKNWTNRAPGACATAERTVG